MKLLRLGQKIFYIAPDGGGIVMCKNIVWERRVETRTIEEGFTPIGNKWKRVIYRSGKMEFVHEFEGEQWFRTEKEAQQYLSKEVK